MFANKNANGCVCRIHILNFFGVYCYYFSFRFHSMHKEMKIIIFYKQLKDSNEFSIDYVHCAYCVVFIKPQNYATNGIFEFFSSCFDVQVPDMKMYVNKSAQIFIFCSFHDMFVCSISSHLNGLKSIWNGSLCSIPIYSYPQSTHIHDTNITFFPFRTDNDDG